jgi:hypothetical protein
MNEREGTDDKDRPTGPFSHECFLCIGKRIFKQCFDIHKICREMIVFQVLAEWAGVRGSDADYGLMGDIGEKMWLKTGVRQKDTAQFHLKKKL